MSDQTNAALVSMEIRDQTTSFFFSRRRDQKTLFDLSKLSLLLLVFNLLDKHLSPGILVLPPTSRPFHPHPFLCFVQLGQIRILTIISYE